MVLVSVVFCNMFLLGLRKIQATPRKQALGFFLFKISNKHSCPFIWEYSATHPPPPPPLGWHEQRSFGVIVSVRVVFYNMYLLGLKNIQAIPTKQGLGVLFKISKNSHPFIWEYPLPPPPLGWHSFMLHSP